MSEYKEILYEKQRRGALITLNRPEAMNAISRSMIKELHQALDEIEEDPEVRAVVLTGAGRAFSAGMDQGNRVGRRLLNLAVLNRPGLFAVEADDISRARQFEVNHQHVFGELLFADKLGDRFTFAHAVGSEEFDQRAQCAITLNGVKRSAAAVSQNRALDDVFGFRILVCPDASQDAKRQTKTKSDYGACEG